MEPYLKEIEELKQQWNSQNYFEVTTSGSTGTPKRIRHSKSSLIKSAELTIERFDLKQNDVFLVCLPVKFIAGMMMVIRAEVVNASLLAITPSINPLEALQDHIDFAALTPLQLEQAMIWCPDKIRLIEKVIIGGAPISNHLLNQIQACEFPTKFYHTYGMTETITHIAIKDLNQEDYTGLFEVLPSVTLSQTADNQLVISAPYLAESPIVTNDIVELRSDQSFRWIERSDDVINSGGLKIFPSELERRIRNHMTNRFFITSAPDQQLGQQVVMFIVDPEKKVDLEELQTKLKTELPSNHAPRQIIRVPKLKMTGTGKVIRQFTKYVAL